MKNTIFAEKTFAYSHKTAKFVKVFSLKSFPLYGIDREQHPERTWKILFNTKQNKYATHAKHYHTMGGLAKTKIPYTQNQITQLTLLIATYNKQHCYSSFFTACTK